MTQVTPFLDRVVEGLAPDAEEALRTAAGAASLLGARQADALLRIPDEQLGHFLKVGLLQLRKLNLSLNFNRELIPTKDFEPQSTLEALNDVDDVLNERKVLVQKGELLPASALWEGLEITRQALSKAVESGRMFTVEVGASTYYPAFYLRSDIDKKTLGKVTKLLGSLPGWSKWQFFTTPKASLGGVTPLAALQNGKVEQVSRSAKAFAER